MKKQTLLLLLSAGLFVASCGKKNEGTTPPAAKTRTELLTGGKWRITDRLSVVTTTTGGTTSVDSENNYASTPDCEKDNFTLFKPDATVVSDEGATKCNASDPQTTNDGTWTFIDGETALRVVDPNGGSSRFKIDELSDSRLRITIDTSYSIGSGSFRLQGYVTFANP